MNPSDGDPCERLSWDSEFFGRPIGRVIGDRLTAARLAAIEAWAAREEIDCLYFLCDPSCPQSSRLAEAAGFRLTDVRVTLRLERGAPSPAAQPSVRPPLPGDVDSLARIARTAHRDSRFFYDGRFPEAACEALYERWLRGSFEGGADAVLVADQGGPVGYATCQLDGRNGGSIGLIGVAENAREAGLGRQLVDAARAWFAARGADPVTVVTQGRNVRAQRLYERAGFVVSAVGLWFHRWREEASESR